MIDLDAADLVLIAGRTLGIGRDAALDRLDPAALRAALADAATPDTGNPEARAERTDPTDAAKAAASLVRALQIHRPFGRESTRLAAAAGLQMLALNGWHADLESPQTAAVVIEAMASGRLNTDAAAAWLAPRLSPAPAQTAESGRAPELPPHQATPDSHGRDLPRRAGTAHRHSGRKLAGALAAIALSSLALLATACSEQHGNGATPAHPASHCTAFVRSC